MSMNRREFIHTLALLCAGVASKPEQVAAFEAYYSANAAMGEELVAIDEIFLSGLATTSMPLDCNFFAQDRLVLPLGLNIFGGIARWVAAPDQKIVCGRPDFFWKIDGCVGDFAKQFRGTVSFIGPDLKREYVKITKPEGSLDRWR